MLHQPVVREGVPTYDFDYFLDPQLKEDVHATYLRVKKEAPPLFWTPRNGGHWVTNTATAATHVLRHPEVFSSRFLSIPPNQNQPKMIPESLDPPEHRAYRQLLRPYFESSAVEPLEPRIIAWTEKLIAEVAGKGECEFVDALSSRLPVSVFMELFGFPLERFEEFRSLVVNYFDHAIDVETRIGLSQQITGILANLIQERTAEPRDDLISTLIRVDFEGRKLTFEELMSIGFLMFLAGLDTVTNAMSFGMRHLAHDEAMRQRMIDDPACIPNAVEELMRRYTFVSTARYVVKEAVVEGATMLPGDSVLVPLHVVGLDEHLNPDPEKVSVDRRPVKHAGFGSGVHTCLGLHLARLELAVFYRVWFERIGHFREVEGPLPSVMRGGSVQALERLYLQWDR